MKTTIILIISFLFATQVFSQSKVSIPDLTKRIDTVQASCGQCQFALKDKKGCDLAVRINGVAYFVEGTKIDEHGDAHASDGFCEAIRKAAVQGAVVNNRFKVSYFKLLPEEKKNKSD